MSLLSIPSSCLTVFIPSGTSGITVRGLNYLDSVNINKKHGVPTTREGLARLHASMIAHACDELEAEDIAFSLPEDVTAAAIAAIITLSQETMSAAESASAIAVVYETAPETAH